jgi:hypothetical protein
MVHVAVGASAEPPHTASVELSRAIPRPPRSALLQVRHTFAGQRNRTAAVVSECATSVRERGLYLLELLRAALVMIRLTGKSTHAKAMPGTQTHQSSVTKPMRNNASPRIETQQIHRVHVLSRRER